MSYLRKKKTTTTETNAKAEVGNEAKFVSVLLKNKVELSSSVEVNINFLGSCHAASKHPGAGTQYGGYRHIYYNFSLNGDVCVVNFTFSGPTKLDVKKPTIKSITEEAIAVLKDLVHNVNLLKKTMVINIQGHSRGGVVADTIHKWISSPQWGTAVRVGKLSIADPYAGPVNRRLHEKMRNFDKGSTAMDARVSSNGAQVDVPSSKFVVYTVAEKRFRTPARALESDIIVFTDISHAKTNLVVDYILKNLSEFKKNKTYVCAGGSDKNNLQQRYLAYKTDPVPDKKVAIDNWIKSKINEVDANNIKNILEGEGDYKNFAYNRISSDGRRALFYKALATVDEDKVKQFLKDEKHTSMLRKLKWQ